MWGVRSSRGCVLRSDSLNANRRLCDSLACLTVRGHSQEVSRHSGAWAACEFVARDMATSSYGISLDPDFIEDVPAFVAKHTDVDTAIGDLNQKYQQFKIAENQILSKRQRWQLKEVEIKQTLDCVEMLAQKSKDQEEAILDYQVAGQIYAKARVPPTTHVNLWLGADIMLEYTLEGARRILEDNLKSCRESLVSNQVDWNNVRDCVTTTEVNIARVYNWDVEKKRKERLAAQEAVPS